MKTLLTIALITIALVTGLPAAEQKPNIVVILADDLRYDCIGAVNPRIHTPNIDRLAKRGVRFSNCYLAGANGAGVCQPSRTQIMAGCSPFHLPVDNAAPGKPGEKPSVPVMATPRPLRLRSEFLPQALPVLLELRYHFFVRATNHENIRHID